MEFDVMEDVKRNRIKVSTQLPRLTVLSTPSAKPRGEAVQIIMDSNALFAPLEFKIDLFGELERLLNR